MFSRKTFAQFLLLLQINYALSQVQIPPEIPQELVKVLHQVSIRLLADDEISFGSGHICSGALVSNFTVLTAASCLLMPDESGKFYEAEDLRVVMGTNDLTQNLQGFTVVQNVRKFKVHPRFNKNSYGNNLALLDIGTVEFSLERPVLPKLIASEKLQANENCYVLGWRSSSGDISNELIQTDVNTVLYGDCDSRDWPKTTFCSKRQQVNSGGSLDTCVGEVGSALVCGTEIHGIVSKTCNGEGEVTQYVDTQMLFNWIYLSHLDDTLKIIDNDFLQFLLFSGLDFVAYYVNDPKLPDYFEVLKYIF